MSLEHQFIVLPKTEYSEKWLDWSFMKKQNVEIANIHDDIIQYILDSLKWIPTTNPSIPDKGYGLNNYGITLIEKEGIFQMQKIFEAWIELFSNAPDITILTGNYEFKENGKGRYQKIKISKQKLLDDFSKIVAFSKLSFEKDYYVVHYGI